MSKQVDAVIGAFRNFYNTGIGLIVKNLPSSGLIWESGNIEISPPSLNFGLHQKLSIKKYELEIKIFQCARTAIFSSVRRNLGRFYCPPPGQIHASAGHTDIRDCLYAD